MHLGDVLPPVDCCNSVKSLAGICIASLVYLQFDCSHQLEIILKLPYFYQFESQKDEIIFINIQLLLNFSPYCMSLRIIDLLLYRICFSLDSSWNHILLGYLSNSPVSCWLLSPHRPSAAWRGPTTCLLLTGKFCTTWDWYTWPCSSLPLPSTSSAQPSTWTLVWGNSTCCWQVLSERNISWCDHMFEG